MARIKQNKEAETPKATADAPKVKENNKEELDSAIKSVSRSKRPKYTEEEKRGIAESLYRALGGNDPFD